MTSVPQMKRAIGPAEVYAHGEVEAISTAPGQPRSRPVTPLRAKYLRDLVIRGRSKNTQEAYTRYVCDLARYYRRSPELISYEEVTGWLYHLIKERQLSASSVNIAVSAVRFLYAVTLGRETVDLMASVPHMKRATRRAEVDSEKAQRRQPFWRRYRAWLGGGSWRVLMPWNGCCDVVTVLCKARRLYRTPGGARMEKLIRYRYAIVPSAVQRKEILRGKSNVKHQANTAFSRCFSPCNRPESKAKAGDRGWKKPYEQPRYSTRSLTDEGRQRSVMLVEPPVAFLPSGGSLASQLLPEVFPHEGVRV